MEILNFLYYYNFYLGSYRLMFRFIMSYRVVNWENFKVGILEDIECGGEKK